MTINNSVNNFANIDSTAAQEIRNNINALNKGGDTMTGPLILEATLSVDTITETTTNNGVVIDGIKVKDSIITDSTGTSGFSLDTTGATTNSLGSTTVNSLQTNIINERTVASGVTVDGIKVKDGIITDATGASGFILDTNGIITNVLGATIVNSLAAINLTANTVPYANGSKQLTSSVVTPTELGYVSGVSSAIQTQLDSCAKIYTSPITESTTSRTLAISDINALIKTTNTSGDTTITIPTNASVAIPVGSIFKFLHLGGTTRLLNFSTSGITLNGPIPTVATGGYVEIQKIDTNTWEVIYVVESGSITFSLSGIWSSSQNCTTYFSRTNYDVIMSIGGVNATQNSAGIITISGWPSRLIPTYNFGHPIRVNDGGSIVTALGWIDVIIGIGIFIYKTPAGGAFSGSGGGGPSAGTFPYPLI